MNFLFIIIIYNKKLSDSKTLKTLKTLLKHSAIFDKKNILICNNGPFSVKDEFNLHYKAVNYHLIETIENRPLSLIYNECINQNLENDYFVILDDDSELTESYINALVDLENTDLLLPHIIDKYVKKYVAPTDNGKIIINDGTFSLKKPGSISSGMVISKNLVCLVKSYYDQTIFDENFALYGIDSTFLIRVKKINKNEKLTALTKGILIHSLSQSKDEKKEVKSFRQKEMSYDIALTLRHYPSFGKFKTFVRDLYRIYKKKNLSAVKEILHCFWKGKHPRC